MRAVLRLWLRQPVQPVGQCAVLWLWLRQPVQPVGQCARRGGRCQRRSSGVTRVTSRITSLETVCSAREGEGVCTTGAVAAADEAEVEANSGVTGVTASDTSRRRVRETTEG